MAAGKVFPSDEPVAKQFLIWGTGTDQELPPTALADKTNLDSSVRELLRDYVGPENVALNSTRAGSLPPYACGGDWDVQSAHRDAREEARQVLREDVHEEQNEELLSEPQQELGDAAFESPAEEPASAEVPPPAAAIMPEEYPDLPRSDAPEPNLKRIAPARSARRKLRPKKYKQAPLPPKRRFLVINQPLSKIAAVRTSRPRDKPKGPDPLATVTRHFERSPVLLNTRFPPSKERFETEYSDEFVWPQTPIRLR